MFKSKDVPLINLELILSIEREPNLLLILKLTFDALISLKVMKEDSNFKS